MQVPFFNLGNSMLDSLLDTKYRVSTLRYSSPKRAEILSLWERAS